MRICIGRPVPTSAGKGPEDVTNPNPGTKGTERTGQLASRMGLVRYTSEGRLPTPGTDSVGLGAM